MTTINIILYGTIYKMRDLLECSAHNSLKNQVWLMWLDSNKGTIMSGSRTRTTENLNTSGGRDEAGGNLDDL